MYNSRPCYFSQELTTKFFVGQPSPRKASGEARAPAHRAARRRNARHLERLEELLLQAVVDAPPVVLVLPAAHALALRKETRLAQSSRTSATASRARVVRVARLLDAELRVNHLLLQRYSIYSRCDGELPRSAAAAATEAAGVPAAEGMEEVAVRRREEARRTRDKDGGFHGSRPVHLRGHHGRRTRQTYESINLESQSALRQTRRWITFWNVDH